MGLAKFLEDNLERLYESLEESKRQVNAIDEESSSKDLGFIKNKISKELELVQVEYEKVLKIVTDPDFDEVIEVYEENLKLEKRLKNKQKVIDLLREAVAKYRSEFESIHGTTTKQAVPIPPLAITPSTTILVDLYYWQWVIAPYIITASMPLKFIMVRPIQLLESTVLIRTPLVLTIRL